MHLEHVRNERLSGPNLLSSDDDEENEEVDHGHQRSSDIFRVNCKQRFGDNTLIDNGKCNLIVVTVG